MLAKWHGGRDTFQYSNSQHKANFGQRKRSLMPILSLHVLKDEKSNYEEYYDYNSWN